MIKHVKQSMMISTFLSFICCFPSVSEAGTSADSIYRLPGNINLRNAPYPENVIKIAEPAGNEYYYGCAVADINKDGFDDILTFGTKDYEEYYSYTPVIYIIYGGRHLSGEESVDDPELPTASLIWESEGLPILRPTIETGDVNGDNVTDIIIPGDLPSQLIITGERPESKLLVIPGETDWSGQKILSEESPGIIQIRSSIDELDENYRIGSITGDFRVYDINKDGYADFVFSYPFYQGFLGLGYILYSGNNMPQEIDVENTDLDIITIEYDSEYRSGFRKFAFGDFDRDNKPDMIFGGGEYYQRIISQSGPSLDHGITYIAYGSVLNYARHSAEKTLSLNDNMVGLTKLTKYPHDEEDAVYNTPMVSAGDINADGYDDLFLGFHLTDDLGYSRVYFLYGGGDFLYSGNLDQITQNITTIESSYMNDGLGSDFAFGDVNGDGYGDCLMDADNVIYVFYGRDDIPDTLHMSTSSPYVSTILGVSLVGAGDINGDGFQDIVGYNDDGIFVVPGEGIMYSVNESIVKPLAGSGKSEYCFQFENGTNCHFSFTKGRPYSTSKLILANYGRDLPDSLSSVPVSQGVVSFYRCELTDMLFSYRMQCSFGYTDSLVNALGIREEDLSISYWNEENMQWEKIASTQDTVLNCVTFITDHFSLFALVDINDPIVADVKEESQIPGTFQLFQNYPNPFNPVTKIRYNIPRAGHISIRIYNILGQEVKTLVNDHFFEGSYEVQWDGTDNRASAVSSGIYIYRMTADAGFVQSRKIVYLK